jgi:hypothetical protein
MKTKTFKKKLSLNKKTIAALSDQEKNEAKGGFITAPRTTCVPLICISGQPSCFNEICLP